MTTDRFLRPAAVVACLMSVGACGGGGGGAPANEVDSLDYPALADRAAIGGPTTITVVVLENGVAQAPATASFDQSTGAITGGDLDGTDIDDVIFTNPANGEISRVVTLSGADSYFGVVGFETEAADRPPMGTTTSYNEGWASVTATTDDGTYTLEADATLSANWSTNRLSGTFSGMSGNLAGTGGVDQNVSNVGNITLSNSVIGGSEFAGGTVTGTGIFAPLDGSSSTSGTGGAFFGDQADEVGGLLVVTDDDVSVIGAFQAD